MYAIVKDKRYLCAIYPCIDDHLPNSLAQLMLIYRSRPLQIVITNSHDWMRMGGKSSDLETELDIIMDELNCGQFLTVES
jgi:hypothetical protein